MEQKLNPVTSISEKDRTKIVNTLFQIKVAGYGHTHCGVNKKNLSQRSFFLELLFYAVSSRWF